MSSKNERLPLDRNEAGSKVRQFEPSSSRLWALAATGIIVLAGVLAYHNSFGGPFILDDLRWIPGNPHIRQIWPPWACMYMVDPWDAAGRTVVSSRPILSLSLALNYQISGLKVQGYHTVDLAIHILTALTLFGIVRGTLLCEKLRARFGQASFSLALVCALIWLVHPLQTQSVTYMIQRAESLMGLFYLLTLYCVIRGASAANSRGWYAKAIAVCALGMGSKEVMATAPLLVLLYDRFFIGGSFKNAFRRRWGLYVGLAATWLVLAALVCNGLREGYSSGLQQLSPLGYAKAQCIVIIHYLRLSFWPHPLVLDYGRWPRVEVFWDFALPGLMVLALLCGSVVMFCRRWGLGFLGLWFFLILGPTSSFFPILDAAFEHRMYLPLTGVVVAVVVCGYALGKGLSAKLAISDKHRLALAGLIGYGLAGAAVVTLGVLTVNRNYDYRSKVAIWEDTVAKRPENWRGHHNLGMAHRTKEQYEEALGDFTEAIRWHPEYAKAYSNRGLTYILQGTYPGVRS